MRKTNSLLMGMWNSVAAKKFSVGVPQMTGRTSHIIHYTILSYMQRHICAHVHTTHTHTHTRTHVVSSLFKTTRKWNQTERPSTWIDEEHVVQSNNVSHREHKVKVFRGREATEATINQKINIVRYCIFSFSILSPIQDDILVHTEMDIEIRIKIAFGTSFTKYN